MTTFLSNDKIIKNLKSVYWKACDTHNWRIVLQILKLQGEINKLERSYLPSITSISDMTKYQLGQFLDVLAKHDPKLKKLKIESTENLQTKKSDHDHPQLELKPPQQLSHV